MQARYLRWVYLIGGLMWSGLCFAEVASPPPYVIPPYTRGQTTIPTATPKFSTPSGAPAALNLAPVTNPNAHAIPQFSPPVGGAAPLPLSYSGTGDPKASPRFAAPASGVKPLSLPAPQTSNPNASPQF